MVTWDRRHSRIINFLLSCGAETCRYAHRHMLSVKYFPAASIVYQLESVCLAVRQDPNTKDSKERLFIRTQAHLLRHRLIY